MPDYVATFRMVGATAPSKTQFKAESISAAIATMLASVNQTSTMNVEEFEVLQVLDGGKYAIVATKNKKETKVVQGQHVSCETAKATAPATCIVAATNTEEGTYTPYTKVEA